VFGHGVGDVEPASGQAFQPSLRGAQPVKIGEHRVGVDDVGLDDGTDKVFLGLEVVVDVAGWNVRGRGDIAERGRVHALPVDERLAVIAVRARNTRGEHPEQASEIIGVSADVHATRTPALETGE
jgi:hypothetical protein